MSLLYRLIAKSDITLLNTLMRAGKGYWGYPEDRLDRFMAKFGIKEDSFLEAAFGFVAEDNKKVIGYYTFKTNEEVPKLEDFFLDTQFIGKGYGRKLWNHCIEQALVNGWQEFVIWSDPNAQAFYEHIGAITIGERPIVTMPGLVAPIMKYVLKKIENS
jgi:GNAT superfamily N-acetyltransferase